MQINISDLWQCLVLVDQAACLSMLLACHSSPGQLPQTSLVRQVFRRLATTPTGAILTPATSGTPHRESTWLLLQRPLPPQPQTSSHQLPWPIPNYSRWFWFLATNLNSRSVEFTITRSVSDDWKYVVQGTRLQIINKYRKQRRTYLPATYLTECVVDSHAGPRVWGLVWAGSLASASRRQGTYIHVHVQKHIRTRGSID